MKLKYLIIFFLALLLTGIIFILKSTYSKGEEVIEKQNDLILKFDESNLEENFYNYIDLIDGSLIPTSSFIMSSILSDNYDFLSIFAIDFILKNIDNYLDDIIVMDNYTYKNYSTNKYVKKDVIYKITNEVFNKKDYLIINDYLNLSNDMVPLLLIDNYDFNMKIDKIINIESNNDTYIVNVKYIDNDLIYKYVFERKEDRLILKTLEV